MGSARRRQCVIFRDICIERGRIESAVRGTVDPDFGRIM